jgi:pro-kumamolisin-like protein/putative Ig domain-containing protein
MIQHVEQKPGFNFDFRKDRLRANPEETDMQRTSPPQSGTDRLTHHCRRLTRQLFVGGLVAAACAALFLPFAIPAQTAGRQTLTGHVPEAARRLQPLGRLAASRHLNLGIALPLRNEAELDKLLQEICDPASTNYHQYLSVEQNRDRFGATDEDYQALINFVQAHGLTVTSTYSNRIYLDVDGTVENIEKTFHVTMRVYQHPTEARTFYAPDVEPSLDLNIPVEGINGLENFYLPRRANFKMADEPSAEFKKQPGDSGVITCSGSGPGGTYMGADFRHAYAPGVTLDGTGQTNGIVVLGSAYSANSIYIYETNAHLSTNIAVGARSVNGYDTNWFNHPSDDGEYCLDIEMTISMSPGTHVLAYEGSSYSSILSAIQTDNVAKQNSASVLVLPAPSGGESTLKLMASQGQSFSVASGDGGAYSTNAIFWPGYSTNVTIVGGTHLNMNGSGASWSSETAWSGSGGGVATNQVFPPWQSGINMSTNHGSTTARDFPDVAMVGDTQMFFVYSNGITFSGIGGTSASSPLWSGFVALINQQAVKNGRPTMGFINPAIYGIGKTNPNYSTIFHDIKSGNNFNSASPTNFSCNPGYDLVTGWGSPNGQNMINALAPPTAPPTWIHNPFTEPNAIAGQDYLNAQVTVATNATDPNGFSLTFRKVSGPAWLGVSGSGYLYNAPADSDVGTNTFVVSAVDSAGLSNVATMHIYVGTNQPPSFINNPFTQPAVLAGVPYSGTIATNAADPDGDALAFAKINGPAWLTVGSDGTLSGAAANTDAGLNTFTVSVADSDNLSNTATMYITVTSNSPPSFISNPFTLPNLIAGQAISGTIATNATDPDLAAGDMLSFAVVSGPAWLTVSNDGTLFGTPANTNAGTNAFVVSVTDLASNTAVATMFIDVFGTPTWLVNPFYEMNGTVGLPYSGTVATNATNPNGDTLIFSKTIGPAWLSVAANGALSGTPTLANLGTNSCGVRVTDAGGGASTAALRIIVTTNQAPVFINNPFSEPNAAAGRAYSGTIATNASDPNPGDILTFAKVGGPAWLSVANGGSLSGTPTSGDIGTNVFSVSVTDFGGLSNTATMNIKVTSGLPATAAVSVQGGEVVLSWSGGVGPYQVQMTTNLSTLNWANVGGLVNTNSLTIPLSNSAAFYRIIGQ